MKTKLAFIGLAFIIFNIINAYSQNHNIGQLKFVLNGVDSILINDTVGNFKGPDSLVIGYQWGNEPSLSTAIYATQNCVIKDFLFDSFGQSQPKAAQEGAYLMMTDYRFFTHSLGDTSLCSSHSMTWEPNMLVESNDTQWEIIAKRPNDPSHPIFGFQQKNDFNISVPYLGWMWFSKPVISEMVYANQAMLGITTLQRISPRVKRLV